MIYFKSMKPGLIFDYQGKTYKVTNINSNERIVECIDSNKRKSTFFWENRYDYVSSTSKLKALVLFGVE